MYFLSVQQIYLIMSQYFRKLIITRYNVYWSVSLHFQFSDFNSEISKYLNQIYSLMSWWGWGVKLGKVVLNVHDKFGSLIKYN